VRALAAEVRQPARTTRLVLGVLALAAIGFGLSQAGKLPGAAGDVVRANVAADREATALFYTEVDGWNEWLRRPSSPANKQ